MAREAILIALAMGCLELRASEDRLEFRVEFPFSIQGKSMPAGNYLLEATEPDENAMRVMDEASGRSIYLNLPVKGETRFAVGSQPQIVFRCRHAACELSAVSQLRPRIVYLTWRACRAEKDTYVRAVPLRRLP